MNKLAAKLWRSKKYVQQYNTEYLPQRKILQENIDILQLNSRDVLVDFGCGNGDFLLLAAQIAKEVVGIDKSALQLKLAQKKLKKISNVRLLKEDFLSCDIQAYKFTKGYARAALHHLNDEEKQTFFWRIAPHFSAGALFLLHDLVFNFAKENLLQRLPSLINEASKYYENWEQKREAVVSAWLNEYPTDYMRWEKALLAGGFKVVKYETVTSFVGRILAKKS